MKEPKELSPIEAAREIEYELLTQKLRNIVQELGELNKKYPFFFQLQGKKWKSKLELFGLYLSFKKFPR